MCNRFKISFNRPDTYIKKIIEYKVGGLQYPEILPLIKDFRDNMSTRFVLETLEGVQEEWQA